MEVIVMVIMFYIVLFLALIVFIKNRISPNVKKIEDLEARIVKLEHENKEIKNKL
ncbi:hypothetical protein [Alteribacillus sp. YIM 98480]|uniref:hypothetical protein n=1 Tax=Alteribacillus sp. YIM 98480 TaxID=2606599 RepID=UPI00131E95DC|nr:hypothetical protein [Alteribacillus sp. YIM 98480]